MCCKQKVLGKTTNSWWTWANCCRKQAEVTTSVHGKEEGTATKNQMNEDGGGSAFGCGSGSAGEDGEADGCCWRCCRVGPLPARHHELIRRWDTGEEAGGGNGAGEDAVLRLSRLPLCPFPPLPDARRTELPTGTRSIGGAARLCCKTDDARGKTAGCSTLCRTGPEGLGAGAAPGARDR